MMSKVPRGGIKPKYFNLFQISQSGASTGGCSRYLLIPNWHETQNPQFDEGSRHEAAQMAPQMEDLEFHANLAWINILNTPLLKHHFGIFEINWNILAYPKVSSSIPNVLLTCHFLILLVCWSLGQTKWSTEIAIRKKRNKSLEKYP